MINYAQPEPSPKITAMLAKSQPQVHAELALLDKRLQEAHSLAQALFERLGPVCHPGKPNGVDEPDQKDPVQLAPLAQTIRAHTHTLDGINYRLQSLLDTLEI